MIPTFSNKIKTEILSNYLGSNLVIGLINYPELGLTDSPTQEELDLRRSLSTDNIDNYEIGKVDLNNYSRQIVTINSSEVIGDVTKKFLATVEFEAIDADFEEATHIIAITGAKISEGTEENGNNRGNPQGTIIFVEPLKNAPFILQQGTSFEYSFTLISNIE